MLNLGLPMTNPATLSVKVGHELRHSGLQVQFSNHSTTLPLSNILRQMILFNIYYKEQPYPCSKNFYSIKTCSITTEHSDLLMILTHQLVCVAL